MPAQFRMPVQQMMPRPLEQDVIMMPRMPFMGQPDYRVYELNRRLQQWTDETDNLWWDAFATEFFEDDAILTLTFCLEDGLKRYTIGRTLIPRYFRSLFEGGVTELFFVLKHSKESFHNTAIILDSDQATMVAHHTCPVFTKVLTEGRLILEFTFDDLMRIRTWHFAVRQHCELIPRSIVAVQQHDPALAEQISQNVTRQGLTNYTLNFLRLCVILEPMQELMSRHKAYGLSPRDCLKTTLFQKWQRMVAPPETNRQPNKRRKRKSTAVQNSTANNVNVPSTTSGGRQKRSPECPPFNPVLGDVMVVGEPTLMGGEFGEKDERLITRLENTQYELADQDTRTDGELAQRNRAPPGTGYTHQGNRPSQGMRSRFPGSPPHLNSWGQEKVGQQQQLQSSSHGNNSDHGSGAEQKLPGSSD